MNTKIYHGAITASDIAKALVTRFNHGNLIARQINNKDRAVVQIASRSNPTSGGQTALGVTLQQNKDGVTVQVGKQSWLGIAASLGVTAMAAIVNPINLITRLDDIAQDFEYLQLDDQIWEAIDEIARTAGASHQLAEDLRSLACEYCNTANAINAPSCMACGAPLGNRQPVPCKNCGFIIKGDTARCPNCQAAV